MGWATTHIARLQNGETISFRPHGNSMTGKISSGQLCTVEPINNRDPEIGEVVLCKVKGKQFLHLITAVKGKQFQISNNHGHVNGWTTYQNIFGRLIRVEN